MRICARHYIDIAGGAFNPLAPFSGNRQSRHGRELGSLGLEELRELERMQLPG